ncbi:hypothetical protein BGZ67_001394 [Mortierella alpina]|nr:hypothetical protein BGZ67_001394 [Mortierella alpina]
MISQHDDQSSVETLGSGVLHVTEPVNSLTPVATDLKHGVQPVHDDEEMEDEQPYGWVIVAAAFFVQAVIVGTGNGYGIYQDRYIHHEYSTATTFQLAWVGTLNVVGMELTGPITGQIADHFGYRICAFLGALVMCAALLATSFAKQVWQLYLFQGLMYGFGASLSYFPSLSLPSQWFKRRRGFATGIVVAGGGFGGLVISPITTVLFDKIGYSWTVRLMALVHLAVIIPAVFLFKTRIENGKARAKRLKREHSDRELAMRDQEKRNEDAVMVVDVKMNESQATITENHSAMDFSVLKDRRFLLLIFSSFFVACGYYCPYFFISTYAQNRNASASTASLLVGILNGSSAVGRVSMGLASDYIGDVNSLVISSLFASLSVLFIWVFTGSSIPVMFVFCVLYGFFSGSFTAIVPTVAAHLCGIKRLASVTGLVYGGIALGALIGSPVGGALLDLSDGKDYLSVQLWTGLVLAASTVMTMVLKLMMNPKLFGRV